MTQLEYARAGTVTPFMTSVAADERTDAETLRRRIADGLAVIPANIRHALQSPRGIGAGLRTKINANIGSSQDCANVDLEIEKLEAALGAGADAVMDLSTGGDIRAIRREIIGRCPVPLGTVPIYEAAVKAARDGGDVTKMTASQILDGVRIHCEDGVDFITVHCGVTRGIIDVLRSSKRVGGVVSRGGSFLISWMMAHGQENPLYERFDEILAMARELDVTLSLGDGLRPGAIADAFDRAQVHELGVLAELADRARKAGVQVMIEGPGHVPLNQIEAQVRLQKEMCRGAPFYVLGPIVTDVAPGYDHITSAIGGAIAASAGADFLCYVTPSEHLGLPTPQDVWDGVMASRIAAHAADVAKGVPGAAEWDRTLSTHRRNRNWDEMLRLALDPARARRLREERRPGESDVCSMCGRFCALKVVSEI